MDERRTMAYAATAERRRKADHRRAQRYLQAVLDDVLDDALEPTDAARVLRHLVSCDHCQHDLEVWREVRAAIARVGVAVDPVARRRLTEAVDLIIAAEGHDLGRGPQ